MARTEWRWGVAGWLVFAVHGAVAQTGTPAVAAEAAAATAGAAAAAVAAEDAGCGGRLSNDRTAVELVDMQTHATRRLLALGRDRAKTVFVSPDGAWLVVVVQSRGVERYAGIAIDLAACDQANTFELPGAPTAAQFGDGSIVLQMPDGSRATFALRP